MRLSIIRSGIVKYKQNKIKMAIINAFRDKAKSFLTIIIIIKENSSMGSCTDKVDFNGRMDSYIRVPSKIMELLARENTHGQMEVHIKVCY